jgi:hypothetical protein
MDKQSENAVRRGIKTKSFVDRTGYYSKRGIAFKAICPMPIRKKYANEKAINGQHSSAFGKTSVDKPVSGSPKTIYGILFYFRCARSIHAIFSCFSIRPVTKSLVPASLCASSNSLILDRMNSMMLS